MRIDEFDGIVDNWCAEIKKRLSSKGNEYTGQWNGIIDRLSQFKAAGHRLGIDPVLAVRAFATKHETWIDDEVQRLQAGMNHHNIDAWTEKIGDSICYNILLFALLAERMKHDKER